jgi:hypothetical protein
MPNFWDAQIPHKSGKLPRNVGNFPDFWAISQISGMFRDILDRYLVFFRSEVDAESPTELRQIKIGRV